MNSEDRGCEGRHVPLKDFYTKDDVMAMLHISKQRFYEYANRAEDPLPLRVFPGTRRGGVIERGELKAWVLRNSVSWNKRG